MGFFAVFSKDSDLRAMVRRSLEASHSVADTASWERTLHLVKERPVTAVVLDQAALGPAGGAESALAVLNARFGTLAVVLVARPDADPNTLLRLGRTASGGLVLVRVDDLAADVPRVADRALTRSVGALVTRAVSPYLAAREVRAVRGTLDGAVRGWSAEEVAARLGATRPHVSVLLSAVGLPSLGRLLTWCKLLHAGRWLEDKGRSAQSIARQLDYSSGAAFRRALRNYTGTTPTAVRESGGLAFVLDRFLRACALRGRGFGDSVALEERA
jgi:AraC-like DNA-binding protein